MDLFPPVLETFHCLYFVAASMTVNFTPLAVQTKYHIINTLPLECLLNTQ